MTQEPAVIVERRGTAIWATINRPARRNAINGEVIEGIASAVRAAIDDPAIRAVVLTGTGDKAFCAGGDLQQGASIFGDQLDEATTDFGRLARLVRDLPVPMIGRINGACVAGGMGLMALCDLVIAADHARFGLPEVKVGVFPYQVQVYFRHLLLPRHVRELMLCADLVDAQRAADIGLINWVVPAAKLDDRLDAVLQKLREAAPVSVKRGKSAIHAMEMMSFHEAISYAEAQIMIASRTRTAAEGIAAFQEKRKPDWIAEG